MSDVAAAPSAPAAAPTNGAAAPAMPAPASTVHAGDNFQEFQAQVQARMAQQGKPTLPVQQPPQQAKAPALQTPAPTPPAAPQEPAPAEPAPTEPAPTDAPPEPASEPGTITPEDLELLAKAKEWMASDKMPEEFLKRLVELKNGEDIEYESWDEVRAQRMRQRDYTRAMQAMQRDKEQWQAHENAYKQHFEAIFSDEDEGRAGGDAMYEIYTRAGKRKQLLALGTRLAREEQAIIDGANGVGYAIMHRLGIKDPNDYRVQQGVRREYARRHAELEREARNRAVAFENQQLRQNVTQRQEETQNTAFFEGQRKSLEQLRPRAFATLGLNHDDPVHRRQFNVYLDAVIRQEHASRVTPEIVMKAARAAREEIELQRKTLAGNGHAKPAGKPLVPQLGPGGGAPAGSNPQQWHAESFAEKFRLPKW